MLLDSCYFFSYGSVRNIRDGSFKEGSNTTFVSAELSQKGYTNHIEKRWKSGIGFMALEVGFCSQLIKLFDNVGYTKCDLETAQLTRSNYRHIEKTIPIANVHYLIWILENYVENNYSGNEHYQLVSLGSML